MNASIYFLYKLCHIVLAVANVSIIALNCALAILVCILLGEIALSFSSRRFSRTGGALPARRPKIAVLVPAHNESAGIVPTLADIKSQLVAGDRLLLVADNCTDDTAAVALAKGAEVIERFDETARGKGYALAFGIDRLASNPPEIVVMIDADCRIASGAIERISCLSASTGRPVQALYLMTAPNDSSINHQVAEFAWRVKNWLRPLGFSVVNLPCQLMGSGMAFPWSVIRSATLADGNIVEDINLGLELAIKGHPPLFCPSAKVTSLFPASREGAVSQRRRWEQGHIHMIVKSTGIAITAGIVKRDWNLLALALDLTVPPLSALALSLGLMFAVSVVFSMIGPSTLPLLTSVICLVMFVGAIILSWLKTGYEVLPLQAIPRCVPYVLKKIELYVSMISSKTKLEWTRTDRKQM